MRTILHICCGPCATATVDRLRGLGHEVAGYFFNPNIHPLLEYRRRVTGARELADDRRLELTEDSRYDPAEWFERAGAHGEDRCRRCIGWRLDETARHAAELGYECFTTSLSISPWQDHEAIVSQGNRAAARFGVGFLYEDMRPLYRSSRELSRELGLYRQKYCGCVLSEWERYR